MTQKMTLIGAGRMGSALAGGWLKAGFAGAIDIVDPHASETVQTWVDRGDVRLNPDIAAADVLVIAVKPQVFGDLAASIAARVGPRRFTCWSARWTGRRANWVCRGPS